MGGREDKRGRMWRRDMRRGRGQRREIKEDRKRYVTRVKKQACGTGRYVSTGYRGRSKDDDVGY